LRDRLTSQQVGIKFNHFAFEFLKETVLAFLGGSKFALLAYLLGNTGSRT